LFLCFKSTVNKGFLHKIKALQEVRQSVFKAYSVAKGTKTVVNCTILLFVFSGGLYENHRNPFIFGLFLAFFV
jgi:hypothetical protein